MRKITQAMLVLFLAICVTGVWSLKYAVAGGPKTIVTAGKTIVVIVKDLSLARDVAVVIASGVAAALGQDIAEYVSRITSECPPSKGDCTLPDGGHLNWGEIELDKPIDTGPISTYQLSIAPAKTSNGLLQKSYEPPVFNTDPADGLKRLRERQGPTPSAAVCMVHPDMIECKH